jgi:hypothetical protein
MFEQRSCSLRCETEVLPPGDPHPSAFYIFRLTEKTSDFFNGRKVFLRLFEHLDVHDIKIRFLPDTWPGFSVKL